jgi:hypothetical protein
MSHHADFTATNDRKTRGVSSHNQSSIGQPHPAAQEEYRASESIAVPAAHYGGKTPPTQQLIQRSLIDDAIWRLATLTPDNVKFPGIRNGMLD